MSNEVSRLHKAVHALLVARLTDEAFGKNTHLELWNELITAHDEGCLKGPYPWCRQPDICSKKGYCQRDPNCGE